MELSPWPAVGFVRGVVYSSWDGSYSNRDAWTRHLAHFQRLGVTWIEILTFAHQPQVKKPRIELSALTRWPVDFIKAARAAGFRILLKPHVWSREFYDGSNRWRGSIRMENEADWQTWFRQYEAFILREAMMAARHKIEMLCIGLEYVEASKRSADWRRLIGKVRAVYPGLLTYAADGNHELGHINFWSDLDVIGVDAYFELDDPHELFGLKLLWAWLKPLAQLDALAKAYKKPIIFTEAGYPSVTGGTKRPWQWPSGRESLDIPGQALGYQALMVALTPYPWFRGVFWWKWYEKAERGVSLAHDYSPEGKPAEGVLRAWYQHQPQ
jgi:hypothetical protein